MCSRIRARLGRLFQVCSPLVGRLALLCGVGLVACAAAPPGAGKAAQSPASSGVLGAAASPSSTSPSAATAPPASGPARAAGPRLPEIVLDPKQPLRPLPELKVENIGLHIGGGPNDADTKAPFLSAVAERFPSFMDCYRKNEEPAAGGRFGIDLHVPRGGGHASTEQPRTALHGPEFRSCLSGVFESVDFHKPKRGPTTISYSLRFTLVDAP